jgi:hypothetical protein
LKVDDIYIPNTAIFVDEDKLVFLLFGADGESFQPFGMEGKSRK